MTRLIADIGGTNARFAVARDGQVSGIEVFACADYPTLADAARAYLDKTGARVREGVFAVAAPLDGSDIVGMMNHEAWKFSIKGTARALGLDDLHVMNDFTAIALAMPGLVPAHYHAINGAQAVENMPMAVIGAGTGLGVAGIAMTGEGRPVVVTTEGGHVTMPAATQREYDLFDWLKKTKYSHVSAERVISGKGIVNLYHAVCGLDGLDLPELSPAEIAERGMAGSCKACSEVMDLFCHFLGVVAGNLALTYGAFGGLFIAGGIVPQLGDYFAKSRFYASFTDKGRYRDYMTRIPVRVVTHPQPGLEGLKNFTR